jgi:hypothetical protein
MERVLARQVKSEERKDEEEGKELLGMDLQREDTGERMRRPQ